MTAHARRVGIGQLVGWLLISGPIREHLWKPLAASVACLALCVVLLLILRHAPWDRGRSFPDGSPLRGRHLQTFLKVIVVVSWLLAITLFCNPLVYFLVFPTR